MEINPEYSLEGLMLKLQYFGHLIEEPTHWKRPWCQERLRAKWVTENDMLGWYHWLNGHEFYWTPGDSGGQGSLLCCSSWHHKESSWLSNWTTTCYILIVHSFLLISIFCCINTPQLLYPFTCWWTFGWGFTGGSGVKNPQQHRRHKICAGKTQRNRVEREVGGGIRMGNTCKSTADSCPCMTKTTTIFKVISLQLIKINEKEKKIGGFNLWVGNIPWGRKWQPTPVCFLGKSHGQRSLVGYI